ncbi:NmrA family NAD(P)-binding protein [bacterium]|nr:NmrA family NAD(P)-binding protein [bacterium]
MILVTGGTGFIGQALIRHLLENGNEVRTLLRPSTESPVLPTGLSVEVALSSINDERNLRAAVAGVDTIFHLVGGEWDGTSVDLAQVEIEGTKTLLRVAQEAGVKRIIYLSHIGADRASAFPVIKVKGIVEEYIRRSGMDYTIVRSGLVYGPGDHFTTALAKLMAVYPFLFFVPAPGTALVQPVWVEDLAIGMTWMLDNPEMVNQTIEIGGPEFLSIEEVVRMVMQAAGMERLLVHLRPSYLRIVAVTLEYMYPDFPHSVYWLDYLANDRTTAIDSMSRTFGLLPERMTSHLSYLSNVNWRKAAREDLRRSR